MIVWKYKPIKYGYVLTWTFLKSRWRPCVVTSYSAFVKKQYVQYYLSEEYEWVPMNIKNLNVNVYPYHLFAPPKIFPTKLHIKIAIKHNTSIIASIRDAQIDTKEKLKTPFPVIRKVNSKMWFTNINKIKKVGEMFA